MNQEYIGKRKKKIEKEGKKKKKKEEQKREKGNERTNTIANASPSDQCQPERYRTPCNKHQYIKHPQIDKIKKGVCHKVNDNKVNVIAGVAFPATSTRSIQMNHQYRT